MTPVRRPPRGSRAAGGNRPIQRLARGSRTRVVTSRPRRDARGRHGWGAGLERACASPGVPGLTSSLVNVWVVLGGRSSEDLLLRGRPRDVHQHFPHFEKMASFQPVTTAPQLEHLEAHGSRTAEVVRGAGVAERRTPRPRSGAAAERNPLVITNTLFQQHKRRLYTWTSPDGQHRNQIDYILCNQRWRLCHSMTL
ncbi:uncharacterized protein LOC129659703 isoform X4 [Bubalus kerabau]|uniref:uncharacterized protein LOC129659703 isoform X4 n=1 Tax=Bubalus carabanensis TaxID=3119969 RepID=UPI00244E7AD3|nr:uncharacterized protein LOC129659703 isoform X4 [Bubalus carabanensis]